MSLNALSKGVAPAPKYGKLAAKPVKNRDYHDMPSNYKYFIMLDCSIILLSIIYRPPLHTWQASPVVHRPSPVTIRLSPVVRYYIKRSHCIVTSEVSLSYDSQAPQTPLSCHNSVYILWSPKCLAVYPIPFQNTMPNLRTNGSAVSEKNCNKKANEHREI